MSLHAVMQSVKEEQAEVAVKQQNDAPSEAGSLSPTDQTPRDPLERFERRQRRYSHDEALRMKASLVKEADETAGKLASPIPFGSPSDSLLSPTSKAVNRFNERRPRRRSHEESKSDVRDVRAGSLVALGFEGLSGRYPTGSAINLKRRPNMKPFTPLLPSSPLQDLASPVPDVSESISPASADLDDLGLADALSQGLVLEALQDGLKVPPRRKGRRSYEDVGEQTDGDMRLEARYRSCDW